MRIPTVSKCCWCADLKATGIILGILSILFGIYDIAVDGPWSILSIINTPISILWLIGIFKEKPALMLPAIIFDALSIILLLFTPIYLFVVYRSFENDSHLFFIKYFVQPMVFIVIVLAIQIYLSIVEYSLYKAMLDKKNATTKDLPVTYEVWTELVKIGREIKISEKF